MIHVLLLAYRDLASRIHVRNAAESPGCVKALAPVMIPLVILGEEKDEALRFGGGSSSVQSIIDAEIVMDRFSVPGRNAMRLMFATAATTLAVSVTASTAVFAQKCQLEDGQVSTP
jgi:hypothetical protein